MEINGTKPKDPEPFKLELSETKSKSAPGEAKSTSDAKSPAVNLEYTPSIDTGKTTADFLKKSQAPPAKTPVQQHDACVKRYGSDGEIVGEAVGKLAGHELFIALGAPILVSMAGTHGLALLTGAAGEKIGEKIGEKSCGPKPEEPKLLPNVPNPDAKKAEAAAAELIKAKTKWYDDLVGAAK